jgi:hypothetical protein
VCCRVDKKLMIIVSIVLSLSTFLLDLLMASFWVGWLVASLFLRSVYCLSRTMTTVLSDISRITGSRSRRMVPINTEITKILFVVKFEAPLIQKYRKIWIPQINLIEKSEILPKVYKLVVTFESILNSTLKFCRLIIVGMLTRQHENKSRAAILYTEALAMNFSLG